MCETLFHFHYEVLKRKEIYRIVTDNTSSKDLAFEYELLPYKVLSSKGHWMQT